jgi:hypothetical protein
MARFVLLVLLVIAGALVVALFLDHRGRRDARFDRLRQAFLHGVPLQGSAHPASLAAVAHPEGLRFRTPGSWAIALRPGGDTGPPPDGRRCVEVEVVRLQGTATGSLADALKAIPTEGERSVEALANGHVLMKSLESGHGAGGPLASYTWRLGRPVPGGGLQLAVFRLSLPVETAAEVIAQADLATLEREVREATFFDAPPAAAG